MVNKMLCPIIRDFIILLIVGGLTLACQLDFGVGPDLHRRGWFRGDPDVSMPLKPDTVSPGKAAIFAFGYPIVALVLLWLIIDRIWSNSFDNNDLEHSDDTETLTSIPLLQRGAANNNNNSNDIQPLHDNGKRNVFNWGQHVSQDSTPRSRKLRFALYQFFVLCLGMCFVITVTTAIKLVVGRLRMDWVERCKPDYNHPDLVIDPESGWIDGKYDFICTGDSHEIIEGRKSFPSAHSSTALYGATFVTILYYKRCWNRAQRNIGFIVIPFLMMATMGGGLVIAASRNWDNRHFASDIIAGCLIGVLCALWTLAFNMYTPSWEVDGSVIKNKQQTEETNEV